MTLITEQGDEEIGRIDKTAVTHRDDVCTVQAGRSVALLFVLRISRCRDCPLFVSSDYCTDRALVTLVYSSVLYCIVLYSTVLYCTKLYCAIT